MCIDCWLISLRSVGAESRHTTQAVKVNSFSSNQLHGSSCPDGSVRCHIPSAGTHTSPVIPSLPIDYVLIESIDEPETLSVKFVERLFKCHMLLPLIVWCVCCVCAVQWAESGCVRHATEYRIHTFFWNQLFLLLLAPKCETGIFNMMFLSK